MNSRKARKNVICQFLSLLIQSGVRGQLLFVNFTIDFCKWVTPPQKFSDYWHFCAQYRSISVNFPSLTDMLLFS